MTKYLLVLVISLLLFSCGEAFPLVLLEAMGCCLPVIVARRKPFDEIVNENIGLIVNENNSKEVSDTITKLLQNDDLRAQKGKEARRYAVNNFSWEKIDTKYYKLFQKQLGGHIKNEKCT